MLLAPSHQPGCVHNVPRRAHLPAFINHYRACKGISRDASFWNFLLLKRSKGYGSGCTTALSGMHRCLYHVYCLAPPTSLCSYCTQNPHRSTVEWIPKHLPTSKTKGKCAGNTPNTLILANKFPGKIG